MTKDQPSKAPSIKTPRSRKEQIKNSSSITFNKELEQWQVEILKLNYEDSLHQLDDLLNELQNDTIPLEDLQKLYAKGKLYLDHCENLLQNIEQEVVELDPDSFA